MNNKKLFYNRERNEYEILKRSKKSVVQIVDLKLVRMQMNC